MADKKVQVIYEMIAELNPGNLNQGVKKINDQLKGIKLSDRMTVEYKAALKEVERLTDNFDASISMPLTDDKALEQAIKDYNALERAVIKLQKVINKAGLDTKNFKWLPDHKDFEKFQLADQIKAELEEAESAFRETFRKFKHYHFNPTAARTGKLKLDLSPDKLIESATTSEGRIPYSLSKADYAAEAILKKESKRLTKELTAAENELTESKKKRQAIEKEPSTTATEKELEALDTLIQKQSDNVKTKKTEKEALKEDINALVELREAYYALREISKLSIEDLSEYAKKGEDVHEVLQRLADESVHAFADALVDAGVAAEDVQRVLKDFDVPIQKQQQYNEKVKEGEKEMKNLESRLLSFFSATNGWNLVQKVIKNAFNVVKDLDAAMTDIAVVTEMTLDQVWTGRDAYSKMARELGAATLDVVKASTLYYQQGLSEAEVNEATTETIKMGRIARIDGARATDLMTSAVRGFNLEMKDSIMINDTYSQIAAKSAANVEELANAMTKTASIAHSAGADFQNMTAFLAQMIETTREPSESLGTAMKTIVARFQEMKKAPDEIGEIDGEIVDANALEKALRTVGIALRNTDGEFRNFDDVIFEISEKWGTMDKMAQRHIATMAAGSRQQSRFIALVQNHSRLMELTGYATDSAGASNEQFEKTLDSLEAKVNNLKTALDLLWTTIMNSDVIKWVIDAFTKIIELINKLTKSFGAAGGTITATLLALGSFKGGKALTKFLIGSLGDAFKGVGADAETATGFVATLIERLNKLPEAEKGFKGFWKTIFPGKAVAKEGEKIVETSSKIVGRIGKNIEEGAGKSEGRIKKLFSSVTGFLKSPAATYLAAAAAAVAVTVLLAKAISQAIHADKIRLEQLRELSDAQQKLIDNTSQYINNLETGTEKLRDLESTMNSLTQGTKEWNKALLDTNSQVLTLINDLPELAKYVEKNADTGALTIGQAGLDKVLEQQQQLLVKQQAAQVATQMSITIQELKVDTKKFNSLEKAGSKIGGFSSEDFQDLAAKFYKLGGSVSELSNENSNSAKTLRELYDSAGGVSENFDEFKNKIINSGNDFTDLGNKVNAASAKLEGWGNTFNALNISGNEELARLMEDKVSAPIVKAIQEAFPSVTTQANINRRAEQMRRGVFADTDPDYADVDSYIQKRMREEGTAKIAEQRAKLSGREALKTDDQILQNLGLEQKYRTEYMHFVSEANDRLIEHYADFQTTTVAAVNELIDSGDLTLETMRIELATRDEMEYQDKETVERHSAFEAATKNFSADIAAAVGNTLSEEGFDAMTTNQIGALTKFFGGIDLGEEDNTELINFIEKDSELMAMLIPLMGDISEDDIPKKAAEKFKAIWDYNETINEKFRAGLEDVKNYDLLTGNVTSALRDQLSEKLMTVEERSGKEAAVGILDVLTENLSHLKSEDLNNVISQILSTDLTDITALNKTKEILTDLGVLTNEQINNIIDSVIDYNQAIEKIDYKQLTDKIQNVGKTLNAIQAEGQISVNEETYQDLIKIDPNLAESFFRELDGSYTYLGGEIKELSSVLEKFLKNLLADQILQKETQIEVAKQLSKGFKVTTDTNETYDITDTDIPSNIYKLFIKKFVEDNKDLDLAQLGIDALTSDLDIDNLSDETAQAIFESLQDIMTNKELYEEQLRGIKTEGVQTLAASSTPGGLVGSISTALDLGDTEGIDIQIAALQSLAVQAGVSKKALLDFQKGIASTNKEEKKAAAAALEHEIAIKGLEKTIGTAADTIYGQLQSLKDLEEGTLEYNNVLEDMAATMNETFGFTIDEDFFFNPENLKLMTAALDGNQEAWVDLVSKMQAATLASEEFANDFGLTANQIQTIANALNETDIKLNGEADLSQIFAALLAITKDAEEAARIIEALSFTNVKFKVDYEKVPIYEIVTNPKTGKSIRTIIGYNEIPRLRGEATGTSTVIDAANKFSSFGSGAKTRPSTSSGGGGSDKEEAPWEQSYDWLYNILQKTNDEIRKRNKLEWLHDKIIKDKGKVAQDLLDNTLKQEQSLRNQLELYRQQQSGRESELKQFQEQYKDLNKYVTFDVEAGSPRIDYNAISKVQDKELGEKIDKAISDYERLSDQLEEIQDNQMSTIDALEELQDAGKNEWLALEDRVLNALIAQYQHEIDELSLINDSINDTNSRLVNAIQKSLDKIRQDRDNEKKADDIKDKEARLAYLRQDTSGANRMEILALEQELSESKESYTDELIDQKISELQEQNDLAAEQRERQIELGQAALDTAVEQGELWDDVYGIMSTMLGPDGEIDESFARFLGKWEDLDSLSTVKKDEWKKDLSAQVAEGTTWLANHGYDDIITTLAKLGMGTEGMQLILKEKQEATIKAIKELDMRPIVNVTAPTPVVNVQTNVEVDNSGTDKPNTYPKPKDVKVQTNIGGGGGGHHIGGGTGNLYQTAYKTGGLADYTGPAWLDGTPRKPELVLNAKDTENFIKLKNILGEIMTGEGSYGISGAGAGDSYYDITIEVDELSNDYDVDKLMTRIKKEFAESGAYRNINMVNRKVRW